MISADELRIGNWVYGIDTYTDKLGEFQVESIYQGEVNLTLYYDGSKEFATKVNPIPLTPEILEKCGFELCDVHIMGEFVKVWIHPEGLSLHQDFQPIIFEIRYQLQHLHQLQNLFWCLTGTELNYKP